MPASNLRVKSLIPEFYHLWVKVSLANRSLKTLYFCCRVLPRSFEVHYVKEDELFHEKT